jgi:hypothetical protein
MVPGLRVQSLTYVRGGLELRAHRVTGAPPGARARLTGWTAGVPDHETRGAHEMAPPDLARYSLGSLRGLHGWDENAPAALRSPQGTAFTRWALVPALTGDAEGTALFAALATLPPGAGSGPAADPGPLHRAATLVSADATSAVIRWSADGAVTRVAFTPHSAEVTTTRGR